MKKLKVLVTFLIVIFAVIANTNKSKNIHRNNVKHASLLHWNIPSSIDNDSRFKGEIYYKSNLDTLERIVNLDDWRGARRKSFFLFGKHLTKFKKLGKNYISKDHHIEYFTIRVEFDSLMISKEYNETDIPFDDWWPYYEGFQPERLVYLNNRFEKNINGNTDYVTILVFKKSEGEHGISSFFNDLFSSKKSAITHISGHICDPTGPPCGG